MKIKITAFTISAVILIAMPIAQIIRFETVIARGKTYMFECKPVDPYDPFRGRYVRIRIGNEVKLQRSELKSKYHWYGQSGWTGVKTGKDGLAKCVGYYIKKPEAGEYVKCKAYKVYDKDNDDKWRVELEVDKVFMNEDIAPKAEAAQRNSKCSVELKIYDGKVVPVKLFMNGKSMVEQLKHRNK